MYPMLYRRKTRRGFFAGLLLLALLLRVFSEPGLRRAVWTQAEALLGSEALYRGAVFLETGVLPEKQAAPPKPAVSGRGRGMSPKTQTLPDTGEAPSTAAVPESQAFPQTEPGAEAAEANAPLPFTAEEAEAISLRGNCGYSVDKTALLLEPLGWTAQPGPRVLILHSHSCESYTQSEGHTYVPDANFRTLDPENSVIAVGDALTEALAALGVEAIHDRSLNDYPDYNSSYANARGKIQAWLEQYPSIVLVLDLHRDALESPIRETVERDGQVLAPLMLVVGSDQGGLNHPHWEDNLSCGLKLQALGNRDSPSLFKALSFRQERFNGDLSPGALIVEVGSTENTLPEATASMPYLARYVAALLQCE